MASTPPALPTQTNQSTQRPSAPSRPLAATRPSSIVRPNPTTQPAVPALPKALAQSTKPILYVPIPPASLTVPTQPTIPAPSTALAQPTTSTRSTAPDRFTGPARVARQAASDSPLIAAGPTRRHPKQPTGVGAPPPRELSTPEIAELHYELNQVLDGADPFDIKFIDTKPGGRKTKVDVQGLLGLSNEAFQTIRVSPIVFTYLQFNL